VKVYNLIETIILHMAKKIGHRNRVHVNRDTVNTQRIRMQQRGSLDWYNSAKCYGDLNINSYINVAHYIPMEFGIVGVTLMALAASGMGGDDGSIVRIADEPTTGHPVIKSLTHTDHDIDISITTDSIRSNSKKPDCSANYNIGRFGTWVYHIARCSIKSLSRES
jgi:hypothetical protein